MNEKDNLRQYRGTVRRDIDEIMLKLEKIEKKIISLMITLKSILSLLTTLMKDLRIQSN